MKHKDFLKSHETCEAYFVKGNYQQFKIKFLYFFSDEEDLKLLLNTEKDTDIYVVNRQPKANLTIYNGQIIYLLFIKK